MTEKKYQDLKKGTIYTIKQLTLPAVDIRLKKKEKYRDEKNSEKKQRCLVQFDRPNGKIELWMNGDATVNVIKET